MDDFENSRELYRRLAVARIHKRNFVECLEGKARAVFPEGTIIIDVQWIWQEDCFALKLQNSGFDVVPEGQVIPDISPVLEKL